MRPYEYTVLEKMVRSDIHTFGYPQTDIRLKRETVYLLGYRLVVDDGNLVRWLKSEKPLDKYNSDWIRMSGSFKTAELKAYEDADSRQLVIFNDEFFNEIHQCFTQMQFVKDHSFEMNEYVLIVTQRSGDIAKLADDLIFFGSICRKWEIAIKTKVRKIIVNYGNLHYEK